MILSQEVLHWHSFFSSHPFQGWGYTICTHTLGTCKSLCSGGCQSSPKEWTNHKMLVCMQHYVEISKKIIFVQCTCFSSLKIDDRPIFNSPAVDENTCKKLVLLFFYLRFSNKHKAPPGSARHTVNVPL